MSNTNNSTITYIDQSLIQKSTSSISSSARPLEGMTFAIKDVILVEDILATGGSAFLDNYQAPYNATVIDKLINAGAIIVSKDNCDMFGHGSTTSNTVYGSAINAIDSSYVAGGSSGGTAVNVALGNAMAGIGSDTGGSIRQPAVYNGLVGFKPSYGAVSRYGLMSYASSLDTVGPIAKSVSDINKIMNVIAGQDEHDMTSHEYIYKSESDLQSYSLKGKKIGIYNEFMNYEHLEPQIKNNMQSIINKLQEQGAEIIYLSFIDPELLVASYYVIAMAETASNLSRLTGIGFGNRVGNHDFGQIAMDSRAAGLSEETKKRIIIGNQILSTGDQAHYYHKANIVRQQIRDHFDSDFQQVDIILSPVSPHGPDHIGATYTNDTYLNDMYTVGFSLGGNPTLALPTIGLNGIQITGKIGDDAQVLSAGYAIEQMVHYKG